jgi:hypothetical protein
MSINQPRRGSVLLLASVIALAGIAIACSEDVPTAPGISPDAAKPLDRSSVIAALSCTANVPERTVTCDPPSSGQQSAKPGVASNIIIGGQDAFISIKSTNVDYNAGTGAFTFDVTLRNLIFQPLGTEDTLGTNTPDPNGIRVFFSSGPTVTGGSGVISVTADGTGTFTGAGQPYYQYSTVLQPFAISSPKPWQLNMPPTVTTFSFFLLVSAAVPRPDGYIDLQVGSLKPPTDKQVTAVVRNALGTIDGSAGPITWSVSDTTRATIDGTGVMNPLRAGNVTIIAVSGLKIGTLNVAVKPVRRVWTGAVDTNWHTNGNWLPDGIRPEPSDTAEVNDTDASVFPTLSQNENIAGVDVLDVTPGGTVPTVALGAFDLLASGDVNVTNSAAINNTSGRLFLTGVGRTVQGTLPALRVTGTYTMTNNITTRAPLRIDAGRLRANANRIRTNSN